MTGFGSYEFGQSTKWLELLKDIAPRVMRAAVLVNRAVASSMAQLGAIHGVAPSFGVEVSSIDLHDAGEMERAITAFARAPNGGLILTGSGSGARRELVITLAAQPAPEATLDPSRCVRRRRDRLPSRDYQGDLSASFANSTNARVIAPCGWASSSRIE